MNLRETLAALTLYTGHVGGESDIIRPYVEDQTRLLPVLARHDLLGVAARANSVGHLDVLPTVGERIADASLKVLAASLQVETVLLDVASLLDCAEIEYMVVRDAARAHSVAEIPADRSVRSVDLMVRSADIDTTLRLLQRLGAQRTTPKLSREFDSKFADTIEMSYEGVKVNVVRSLCEGPFGVLANFEDLFDAPSTIEIAGANFPVMGPTSEFISLCFDVAIGDVQPRLIDIRDLLSLDRSTNVDFERFEHTMSSWSADPVAARAKVLIARNLGSDHCVNLARNINLDTLSENDTMMEPYVARDRRLGTVHRSTVQYLKPIDRLSYITALGLQKRSAVLSRRRD